MTTLYDLLGALADDDADDLRAAFRKAAKANHPDNNPGDLDAAGRFRQIVRANAILRDEQQRALYDRLLEKALRQQGLKSGRAGFTARSVAPYAVAGIAFVMVLAGGDLGLAHMFKSTSVPIQEVVASVPEPAQIPVVTLTERFAALEEAGPRNMPADIGPSKTTEEPTEKPGDPKEAMAMAPSPAAPVENADDTPTDAIVPRLRDFGVNDARYYRERGVAAYRSGDIYVALADFDLAIGFDPTFSDAYVDRGIVLYRMGDLKHALADVAQAKRIDDSNRSATLFTPQ
jgi:curved DNA-binding protein CbpA